MSLTSPSLFNSTAFVPPIYNAQPHSMGSYITTPDNTQIYYKDWGNPAGEPIVFSHGWPLSSDNWENQMFFLSNEGYRVVAHDRRGHGRSSQPWAGNDMDTAGGGEVARFLGRHGTSRVSKAVLVSAVTPHLLQSETNPAGLAMSVFDGFRSSMRENRAQFFVDVPTGPFFGFNRANATVSQGLIDSWWQMGMQTGFVGAYECVKAFSETDFTDDLKKINIPTLVVHGSDDQVVPIAGSAYETVKLLPDGKLKVYQGGPHALPNIFIDELNQDLLDFVRS